MNITRDGRRQILRLEELFGIIILKVSRTTTAHITQATGRNKLKVSDEEGEMGIQELKKKAQRAITLTK